MEGPNDNQTYDLYFGDFTGYEDLMSYGSVSVHDNAGGSRAVAASGEANKEVEMEGPKDNQTNGVFSGFEDLSLGVSGDDNAGGSRVVAADGEMEGPNDKQKNQIDSLEESSSSEDLSYGESQFDTASSSRGAVAGGRAKNKKARDAEKLAKLWAEDPKRAKRILANRKSAGRSKQKKQRFISELGTRVEALQAENKAQDAESERVEKDLAAETAKNRELKIRVPDMAQRVDLQKALNLALETEVVRLRIVSQDTMMPGLQHDILHPNMSNHHSQSVLNEPQITMLPVQQYGMPHPNMSNHHSQSVLNEPVITMMPMQQHDMVHPNMSNHHSQSSMLQYDMPHPNMSNHQSQSGLYESQEEMMPMQQYDTVHPHVSNHHSRYETQSSMMLQYAMPHTDMENHTYHLLADADNHAQSFSDMLLSFGSHNSHLVVSPEKPSVAVKKNNSTLTGTHNSDLVRPEDPSV